MLVRTTCGTSLAGLGPRDELRGNRAVDTLVAIASPQGDANHLERDTQDALGLRIEPLAVKKWGNWHGSLPLDHGGSATGLSVTGA